MRRLTDDEFAASRAALLAPGGDDLRQAVFDVGLGRPVRSGAGLAQAQDLGWIVDDGFTDLGRPIADPIREFVF